MITLQNARDNHLYNGIVSGGYKLVNGTIYYDVVATPDVEDLTPVQMQALYDWSH